MHGETQSTVFLVDDEFAVRDSIAMLLETAGIPVECYASAGAFLEAYDTSVPGCLLVDVSMPDINGLELQKALIERDIPIPIIFISGHGDVRISAQAFRAGAVDFIEKPFDDDILLARIQEAMEADRRIRSARQRREKAASRYQKLTPREKEVMHLVIEGLSNKQIGKLLGISNRTIDTHRARVMEKMQATSLSELVTLALECELSR